MIQLNDMVERIAAKGLLAGYKPGEPVQYDHLTADSREAGPTSCFVAVKGSSVDGHRFIPQAMKQGVRVIVCESEPEESTSTRSDTAFVHVSDSRRALVEIASMHVDDPGEALKIVGVTGTNGKTTVATLSRHLLECVGYRTGFIGTTGYYDGRLMHGATQTTPSPTRVYQLLATMRDTGCAACSMELSSHALDQHRIRIADVDVAIFTNLTRDHLDYHGSESCYLEAKTRLFEELSSDATGVVNMDDPSGASIKNSLSTRSITYGTDRTADIRYELTHDSIHGLQMKIDGHDTRFRLSGAFNAANLAAAYGCGLALGMEPDRVLTALETADPVPGRFEVIEGSNDRPVIIDYAHTPDALEHVLRAIGGMKKKRRVWCVFGCGGNRDTGKRAQMGAIAERLADRVIVTSDNPRFEDPLRIIEDVCSGMVAPENTARIVEREEAIAAAADGSLPGDIILIAGKGHETVQVIGDREIPFDDRLKVQRYFSSQETLHHSGRPGKP